MEFFIKKNATLPLLKLQVVKNGRADFNKFMDMLEQSAMFFSMVDTETGIAKISSRPAGFVEKTKSDPNAETEYYLYYQFQNRDTNKVGRYEAQFMLRNSEGVLILPIREKLYVNVQESFIADDLPYDSCYVSEFPCCINGPFTTTTTTVPCPSCPTCPEPTPTPFVTTTTTTIPEFIIQPIITENDEYIEVGENEYLMYVDPEIEYAISTEVTSGSVETTFTVTSNFGINYNVTIPLTVKLGLVGGGTIDVTANVIMLPNQVVGQAIVTNPSISYSLLDRTGELFVGAITPQNFPISILASQIQFQQEPTPTPTPTPTVTPTQTITPTPTITPSSTPLPPSFISVWQTNAPGDTITLPYDSMGTYSGTIDWGDGTITSNSYANRTHSYAVASAHTITITGQIEKFSFIYGGVASKLLEIKKWGPLNLGNDGSNFYGCSNLILSGVTDTPNLSGVTTLSQLFRDCSSLKTINNSNSWDVSNVTDMSRMFAGCTKFNSDISSWVTSAVTTMNTMFIDNNDFNQNIGGWDVSNVTNMNSMFTNATLFNQDIGGWNVSGVTNMTNMFANAQNFNQNIGGWDVSNVVLMDGVFGNTLNFNQNIGGWDVSSVTSMGKMFSNATSFNQDLSSWCVSLIPSLPSGFDNNTPSWLGGVATRPQWGTCPGVTPTPTPTNTQTPTPTPTNTQTPTPTPTNTETPTPTPTPTSSTLPPNPFISIWRTTAPNETIYLPLNPGGLHSGTIDWGDGNVVPNTYANRSHTYTTSGDYVVTIDGGIVDGFSFGNYDVSSSSNLIEVTRWGCLNIGNSGNCFLNCSNLVLTGVTDTPNLVGITNLSSVFFNCTSLTAINNVNSWDVSNITNMSSMFDGSAFNQSLMGWNVSGVTNMSSMFAASNFNGDISNWDVSSVTDMYRMFQSSAFNQNIGSWNVSGVTNMSYMFGNTGFNGDIGNWDVSSVVNMEGMFAGATSFNQSINNWNVSNVTNMLAMFNYAANFNQPIGDWDVSNVTNMTQMFQNATSFNQNINNWNVSGVTNMTGIFRNASNFDQPLSGWNVSNVTNISGVFQGATNFNQNINNWDVSNVTNMSTTFELASSFNQPLNNWNVSGVTNMQYMFNISSSFDQDISNWDVSNVTDMSHMFFNASSFNQDLSTWCVSQIPSLPSNFDTGASSWAGAPATRPQWGAPRQIVVPTLWNGNIVINSNTLQLTQTPNTLKIQLGDTITDINLNTSVVGTLSSDGTYTYVGTGPGGGIAFNCQFPLTFSGPC